MIDVIFIEHEYKYIKHKYRFIEHLFSTVAVRRLLQSRVETELLCSDIRCEK